MRNNKRKETVWKRVNEIAGKGASTRVNEVMKGIEREDQQHTPGRGMGHWQMEVVGNRFSWQHQRLLRVSLGCELPLTDTDVQSLHVLKGHRTNSWKRVCWGLQDAVSHLQSLLETRHHLKNLSGLMLPSAALNVEKKKKSRTFFLA